MKHDDYEALVGDGCSACVGDAGSEGIAKDGWEVFAGKDSSGSPAHEWW